MARNLEKVVSKGIGKRITSALAGVVAGVGLAMGPIYSGCGSSNEENDFPFPNGYGENGQEEVCEELKLECRGNSLYRCLEGGTWHLLHDCKDRYGDNYVCEEGECHYGPIDEVRYLAAQFTCGNPVDPENMLGEGNEEFFLYIFDQESEEEVSSITLKGNSGQYCGYPPGTGGYEDELAERKFRMEVTARDTTDHPTPSKCIYKIENLNTLTHSNLFPFLRDDCREYAPSNARIHLGDSCDLDSYEHLTGCWN